MLEFIAGEPLELTPTSVVVDHGGLGYLLQISMQTYAQLEGQSSTKLYVHEVLREDTHELYGFATKDERALFRLLIAVSGVGPNTARLLLSSYDVAELSAIIRDGDSGRLCRAKGIGSKTAQRIIVDLQAKVGELTTTTSTLHKHNTNRDEALFALIALGFPRAASERVIDAILKSGESHTVEQIVKLALRDL